MTELKTITIDTKFRFYQVAADHKCSVEKLQHCLLVVKSDKENGAIIFDDGRAFEPFFQPVPRLNSPIPTIHSDAFSVLF